MADVLKNFSVGSLSNVLFTVIAAWMIWPILCGVLGARRGAAMQGVMHGLLWGPVGLIIVLLIRQKHTCPTCGKRTLTRRIEGSRAVPPADALESLPVIAWPAGPARRTDDVGESGAHSPGWSREDDGVTTHANDEHATVGATFTPAEEARLRAWLNGEDTPPATHR